MLTEHQRAPFLMPENSSKQQTLFCCVHRSEHMEGGELPGSGSERCVHSSKTIDRVAWSDTWVALKATSLVFKLGDQGRIHIGTLLAEGHAPSHHTLPAPCLQASHGLMQTKAPATEAFPLPALRSGSAYPRGAA